MTARIERLLADVDLERSPQEALDQLCIGCTTHFDVQGAAVALIVVGELRGALSATDRLMTVVEELQFSLGEGPCLDAYRSGKPVLEADLSASLRWPAFAPAATEAGVRAVYAIPLQMGSARFGALDLYRTSPGLLSREERTDALAVADIATVLLLSLQAEAPPGSLPGAVAEVVERRVVVNQAAGMVSVQLGVSIEDAHVALRARAYAEDRPLGALAADVVGRRARLEP